MRTTPLLLLVAVAISACHDDSDSTPNSRAKEIENIAMQGSWHITRFEDSGDDETSNFTGYAFEFKSANVLRANKSTVTYSGTWSITDDDKSGDDNSNDDIDFNIAFTTPDDFEELSEDWEIISISSSKIDLQHISGGNGGTDLLTLEKLP